MSGLSTGMLILTSLMTQLPMGSSYGFDKPDWQTAVIASREHNFGTIPRGSDVSHEVELTNVWAEPLVFERVDYPGSLQVAYIKKARLAPGEKTKLVVTLDGARFSGPKSWLITIAFKVGENTAKVPLIVRANARPDVVVNPRRVDLGVVSRLEKHFESIEIEYAGKLDWKIESVVTNNGSVLLASVEEIYRRQGAVGYRLRISVIENASFGEILENVIVITNDCDMPRFPVAIVGKIEK